MEDDDLTISEVLLLLFESAPEGYPIPRTRLAYRCGVPDDVMRHAVAKLRVQGHLIVADADGGYRLATSSPDVLRYTASLRSRIIKLARVVRAMESEAARQFGDFEQLPLDLVG